MVMWILAGYILAAAAFYSYIVTTAQEEPKDQTSHVFDLVEYKNTKTIQDRRVA